MIIYHNPRCSKSRQTLALLRENGADPKVVEYLKTPFSSAEIREIQQKLGSAVTHLVRTKEPLYKELGLKGQTLSLDEIAQVLSEHPKLIERPIVVTENRAVLGRPPENALVLLSS